MTIESMESTSHLYLKVGRYLVSFCLNVHILTYNKRHLVIHFKTSSANEKRLVSIFLIPVVKVNFQNSSHDKVQSTTVNSSPSKFKFFVRINRGAELKVYFSIGSQWSMSREIV